jgi:hypothetical protein
MQSELGPDPALMNEIVRCMKPVLRDELGNITQVTGPRFEQRQNLWWSGINGVVDQKGYLAAFNRIRANQRTGRRPANPTQFNYVAPN